jgi:malonate decarboxylase beta subunit
MAACVQVLFSARQLFHSWRPARGRVAGPARVMPISTLEPLARLAAIADTGSVTHFPDAGASPHVARWGIVPAANDGVVCARFAVDDTRVLGMAQDARFLGGSVGANHGEALRCLFVHAQDERPGVVVLLIDSGGVRLHEANAAEWALARALRALLDVRRAGIPVVAIVTGAAFGGASVLAAACTRLWFLPNARFGLSGPGVIETTHGKSELNAGDREAVAALFGATARVAAGIGSLVADDIPSLRGAVGAAARHAVTLDYRALAAWEATLAGRLAAAGVAPAVAPSGAPPLAIFADARPVDPLRWLWRVRDSDVHLLRPLSPQTFGPAQAVAIAQALANGLPPRAPLLVVEDSRGHASTRRDESLGVSEYLAAHAARLALLEAEGRTMLGLLAGCGHSAAFFANALQIGTLDALNCGRIEAMAPEAIARVTRLPSDALAALIENDPLLGQPVRHLAAMGGVARVHATLSRADLLARIAALRQS